MENQKKVIFAFRGDPLCFIHVLLNGIDLHERGQEGLIVIEGEAVTLVPQMSKPDHFLFTLYKKAKTLGILHGACKACSIKLKVEKEIESQGIPFIGDMSGHPSMGSFIEKGYEIITF
ncbi:cytoplasmic protein [Desulfobacula sp.]